MCAHSCSLTTCCHYTHTHTYTYIHTLHTRRETRIPVYIYAYTYRGTLYTCITRNVACLYTQKKDLNKTKKKKKNMKIYNRGFHAKRSAARCAFKGLHPNYDAGYIR